MDDAREPEQVLFAFLIANLTPDEQMIRSLIVDHPDADILWEGSYPEDVAALLVKQYGQMEILRIEDPEHPLRIVRETTVVGRVSRPVSFP